MDSVMLVSRRVLILLLVAVLITIGHEAAGDGMNQFEFEGFTGENLTLDGVAEVTSDGLLMLTNGTAQLKGHAFHPSPLRFKDSPNGTVKSFSTTFVFAILGEYIDLSGHGIAFFVSPSNNLSSALPSQYLGLLNIQNNGNATNHIFAVELDTILSTEFKDIDDNHVGIDINSLKSSVSHSAGYYDDATGGFKNLSLISRLAMQVWVEYDGGTTQLNVTLAPVSTAKPKKPLLSTFVDLSPVISDPAYVGFASSTGSVISRHYVLGWSFGMNRAAPYLDDSKLPTLPYVGPSPKSLILDIVLPIASAMFVLTVVTMIAIYLRRRMRYAELREEWEVEFGPHRFCYKDLFRATEGFKDKQLLGTGGFGRVYRGVLPTSKVEVAVKKVSHESRQGIKDSSPRW